MTPESIGLKNQALNLTSRSGRAAVKSHMDAMGYKAEEYNLDALYADFQNWPIAKVKCLITI